MVSAEVTEHIAPIDDKFAKARWFFELVDNEIVLKSCHVKVSSSTGGNYQVVKRFFADGVGEFSISQAPRPSLIALSQVRHEIISRIKFADQSFEAQWKCVNL